MDKNKILKTLQADLIAAKTMRDTWYVQVDSWKREYEGMPYGNETKGKSQIVSKDIKKQIEWLHPSLLDPFVSTQDIVKVTPVTWEDTASARQSEMLLNYQFCRQFNRYSFMSKALKVLAVEGTLVVQTGWDYQDEEVEVESEVVVADEYGNQYIENVRGTETRVLVNKPTATVCRNEDIYIDPTCMDDMDKCQFIIHRYETDFSTLKKDGRYKNLDKAMDTEGVADPLHYTDYLPEDRTYFKFQDKARKKVLVHEYWGNYDISETGIAEPIVCAWIGDTIIRLQSNPYPDKKPPFIIVPFNAVPFQMHGESDAELISDSQKINTAIKRGLIDNMAQSTNGQIGIRKGALDLVNKKRFQNGQSFEFNGTPNDFWQGSFNQIPGSAFDMLSVINNEIESLTAVKSFSQGLTGGSLGGTATAARGTLDATAVRRLNRVRNIAENLIKPLMRKWLAYDSEFLMPQEVVRLTNEQFVEINRDDLTGKVDLDIEVSTSEDNAAKAQELAFMLQTLGQTMDAEMRNMIMADIAKLHKMPELEKRIREFKPQQDPMQEQIRQLELQKLQLENEKLKADIADKYARAGENEIDKLVKQQKAELEKAKTRKLHSDSDLQDLKFLREDSGIDHKREMEKKDFDRSAKMDMESLKLLGKGSK